MFKTSIICSTFAHNDVEDECLKNIVQYSEDYELFVCDGKATKNSLSYLWNHYAEKADADFLIFMNSDASPVYNSVNSEQKGHGWNLKLAESFYNQRWLGAVGPVTTSCKNDLQLKNSRTWVEGQKLTTEQRYIQLKDEVFLAGFCFGIPKRTFMQVGGFDAEAFPFYGNEKDLFFRIYHKMRLASFIDLDVFVWHKGENSIRTVYDDPALKEVRKEAREKFFDRVEKMKQNS